jgi:hypothetical protein
MHTYMIPARPPHSIILTAVSRSESFCDVDVCFIHSYDQKLFQVNNNSSSMHCDNLLEPVPHCIPHTRDAASIIQAPDAIPPDYILRDRPRADVRFRRHLRAALDKFGRRRNYKGCEAAGCACEPDFGKGGLRGGAVGEEGERAVVGYEEESVEGAVAEDGCCCAYAMEFLSVILSSWIACVVGNGSAHL